MGPHRLAAPRPARQPLRVAYLFGAVCPQRAVGAALVMLYADSQAMNLHLQVIGRAVAPQPMPYSCSMAPDGTPATLLPRQTTSRFSVCRHTHPS